jgi:hypothetical protein
MHTQTEATRDALTVIRLPPEHLFTAGMVLPFMAGAPAP